MEPVLGTDSSDATVNAALTYSMSFAACDLATGRCRFKPKPKPNHCEVMAGDPVAPDKVPASQPVVL